MTNTKQLEKKINREYKTGNVKSAIELCQIGLQEDPTNADLHVRLGDLYLHGIWIFIIHANILTRQSLNIKER